jgi:hypothetical protein
MVPRPLCFAVAILALAAPAVLGALACLGPDVNVVWSCINPETGMLTGAPYDANHYVGGVFDPCHCYDPCGELKSCPITIDAGSPPPGCDAGQGTGGTGTGSGDGG